MSLFRAFFVVLRIVHTETVARLRTLEGRTIECPRTTYSLATSHLDSGLLRPSILSALALPLFYPSPPSHNRRDYNGRKLLPAFQRHFFVLPINFGAADLVPQRGQSGPDEGSP
ncbi:hypothetical protein KM043_010416 [Ampulex compressa]|nr:hypothetical protein KM043_010416 [Ampulex compressa]